MQNDFKMILGALLKFGERNFNLKLLNEGHIHMKSLSYFRTMEKRPGRFDPIDGIWGKRQLKNGKIKIKLGHNGKELNFHSDGEIKTYHNGNLYCLFAITDDWLKINRYIDHRMNAAIEPTVVVISKPTEFISRIVEGLKSLNFDGEYGFVTYTNEILDNDNFNIPSPFYKSVEFAYQSEFRFYCKNEPENDLDFKIGPLHDIAEIIDCKDLPLMPVTRV